MNNSTLLAAALCKRFEGFRSKPYLCPAGVATIGYGSTVYPGGDHVTLLDPPISKVQAQEMLVYWLDKKCLPDVIRLCPSIDDESNLAAILDFVYNLGSGALKSSTLRKKINANDWAAVPAELRKWVNGGGRKLNGLVLRREAEILLL